MQRILQYSAVILVALLTGYVVAFHGVDAVAKQALMQSRVLQGDDPHVRRQWMPMPVIGF